MFNFTDHISDNRMARLELSEFDSVADWLKNRTGWQAGDPGHINDLMDTFLAQAGFDSGALPERWHAWLASQGHDTSDHLADRTAAFWATEAPLP